MLEQYTSCRDFSPSADRHRPLCLQCRLSGWALFRGGAVGSNRDHGMLAAPKQCSGRITHPQKDCLTTEYSRETVPRPELLWRSDQCCHARATPRSEAPETEKQPTEPPVKESPLVAARDLSIQVGNPRIELRLVMRPATHTKADAVREILAAADALSDRNARL